MNKRTALLSVLALLTSFLFLLISCPGAEWPNGQDPVTTDKTLTDGTKIAIEAPESVTVSEVTDTSAYDAGFIAPLVQITGSLPEGETAVLSFSSDAGFSADDGIAYYNAGWIGVDSTVSDNGKIISATVDHFSIWTVIRPEPEPSEPVVTEETLSDGVVVKVEAPETVSCIEVTDTTDYEAGFITALVDISGSLSAGETAEITFNRVAGFGLESEIAYYDSGWVTEASTISGDGKTISATVDHFSVWAVVEPVPSGPVDISGTVYIDMGSAWNTAFESQLPGKILYIMLVYSDTFAAVDGALASAVFEDWDEPSAGTFAVDYLFENIEAGSYIPFAFVDIDVSGTADGDEPQGMYVDGGDEILIVVEGEDQTDIGILVNTISISGTVTLDAAFAGGYGGENIYIQLMIEDEATDELVLARYAVDVSPHLAGTGFPIAYTLTGVPYGFYFLTAFVDMVADGEFVMEDGEPFGFPAENIEAGTGDLVWFPVLEDVVDADIHIDILNDPPSVSISSPADLSSQEELVFDVTGTASDDIDDLEGESVAIAVFRSADVITHDPPDFSGDPVVEDIAIIDAAGDWTFPALDLSAFGYDNYSIFVEVTDFFGLSDFSYSRVTIENVFIPEGLVGDPLELTVDTPHAGEVDLTFSYYRATVVIGESYLVSISNLTDLAKLQLYQDINFTTWLKNGVDMGPDTRAFGLDADSTDLFLRVSGSFCTTDGGAQYDITVEHLTQTISIGGTVTIAGTFPATHPMYIDLQDGNGGGTILRLNKTAVMGESEVAFDFVDVRQGYFNVFAFIDEDGDETWDYGTPNEYFAEYVTGGSVWIMDDVTGITMEVMQGEF